MSSSLCILIFVLVIMGLYNVYKYYYDRDNKKMIWVLSIFIVTIIFLLFCGEDIKCKFKKHSYVIVDGSWYIEKTDASIGYCEEKLLKNPVVYNFNTHIYHDMDCEWSQQCIESCVYMEESKAEQLGRRCYECTKIEQEAEENYEPEDYTYEDRFGIEN